MSEEMVTYLQVPLCVHANQDVRALAAVDYVLGCFPQFPLSDGFQSPEFRCRVVKMLAEKYLGEFAGKGPP